MALKLNMTGDAEQVAALLEWAQEHGVRFDAVTVGGCHVTLRMQPGPEQKRPTSEPRRSVYQEFGGKLWEQAVSAGMAGVETGRGDDLEPALDGGAE